MNNPLPKLYQILADVISSEKSVKYKNIKTNRVFRRHK
jgi:hypothetical protein